MAVNLVGQVGRERAGPCWSPRSRSSRPTGRWSGSPGRCAAHEEALEGYREAMTCDLGDFAEYAALRRRAVRTGRRSCPASAARPRGPQAAAVAGGAAARRRHPGPRRAPGRAGGRLDAGPQRRRGRRARRPLVLTIGKQVKRLSPADFPVPVEPIEQLRIPKTSTPRSPQQPPDLASTLRTKLGDRDFGKRAPGRATTRPRTPRSPTLRRQLRAASLPRLRRPRGPRPLGRALLQAGARDRGAAPPGRGPLARHRPHLRPGLRACWTSSATSTATPSPPDGPPAGTALHRAGPADRRVPARRALGRPGPGRAGRLRVRAGLRVAPGRRRPPPRIPRAGCRRRWPPWSGSGASSTRSRSDHGLSFLREPDLGFAWAAYRWARGARLDACWPRRPTWPPATSSAGSSS